MLIVRSTIILLLVFAQMVCGYVGCANAASEVEYSWAERCCSGPGSQKNCELRHVAKNSVSSSSRQLLRGLEEVPFEFTEALAFVCIRLSAKESDAPVENVSLLHQRRLLLRSVVLRM